MRTIPDRGQHLTRTYGAYANRNRSASSQNALGACLHTVPRQRLINPPRIHLEPGQSPTFEEYFSFPTVKGKIQHLIQEEDAKRPLSDSELTRMLQREGINIARRTVAKYRDELGVPSSTNRKQVF